jgi:hypothetical protein
MRAELRGNKLFSMTFHGRWDNHQDTLRHKAMGIRIIRDCRQPLLWRFDPLTLTPISALLNRTIDPIRHRDRTYGTTNISR